MAVRRERRHDAGGKNPVTHRLPQLLLGALLLAGLGAACTADRRVVTLTATPAPSTLMPAPADSVGPYDFPPGVNPLTGLPVDSPGVLNRRPLAIKISNAPDSVRPQAGIGEADLVFEHYVEGHLTRFTAIFWTHAPPRVGSVRSARLIDLEIPVMYGALFAYSGASDPIRQRIAESPFAQRAYEGVSTGEPLYFRDPQIDMPHNLFVIPAEVWARARADGVDTPPDDLGGIAFSAVPPAGPITTRQVTIDYGPDLVRWEYDPGAGRYLRFSDGEPHRDANTGQQVSAANVVLLYAPHREDTTIVESEWQGKKDYSIEIQLWTSGPATLFRDGQTIQGFWIRGPKGDTLSFWADKGGTQSLYFKPGSTWFEVVPVDFTGVTVQ
jgi:hypothetical protein